MDYPILFLMLATAVPIGALWGRSPRQAAMAGAGATLAIAVLFAMIAPPASAAVVAVLLALVATVLWGIPAAILSRSAQRSSATLWYSAWAIASYLGMLVGLLVLNAMRHRQPGSPLHGG